MEQFASQDPRSYSLYFELNIWLWARTVSAGDFQETGPWWCSLQGQEDVDPSVPGLALVLSWTAYSLFRVTEFKWIKAAG